MIQTLSWLVGRVCCGVGHNELWKWFNQNLRLNTYATFEMLAMMMGNLMTMLDGVALKLCVILINSSNGCEF
jgi:hypothetical protein